MSWGKKMHTPESAKGDIQATDEIVPDAKPGPSVADPYARLGKRSPLKCGRCPKWQRRTSVCPLRGCHQALDAQACRYGANLIRREET